MKIALVGAPGTGKTSLAEAIVAALQARSHKAHILTSNDWQLPDYDFAIVDGTPLFAAVQRDVDAHDKSLYPHAITQQARYDIRLLAGLDLPHTNTDRHRAFDARLREVLQTHQLRYSVVYGIGGQRTASALLAIYQWSGLGTAVQAQGPSHWQWVCDKCSDAQCEHQLFTSLLGREA